MDESVTRSNESTLVLRHVHHRHGALVDQVILEGLERARARCDHALLEITWVFLVLDLRAENAVIVDVHDAVVVVIESLEDGGSGYRCTRHSTVLARCMRTFWIVRVLI